MRKWEARKRETGGERNGQEGEKWEAGQTCQRITDGLLPQYLQPQDPQAAREYITRGAQLCISELLNFPNE